MEELLPKGATELTKQQIRYLLQVSSRLPTCITAVGHQGETLPQPCVSVAQLLLFLFLLQTRLTADKSMRLLLSTFSSLREELLHMSEDLRVRLVLLVGAVTNVLMRMMMVNVCSVWRRRRRAWRETWASRRTRLNSTTASWRPFGRTTGSCR